MPMSISTTITCVFLLQLLDLFDVKMSSSERLHAHCL